MPLVGASELKMLVKAIKANYINEGPMVAEFEQKIATILGVKHAIATTSGTVAIFLGLKALGVGKGDEVLVPDITFIATANAVDLCGATPILVDVDPNTLNISVAAARRAITARTKAIIPVHVTGRAADMDALCLLAKERRLFIVEDAAEALTSKYKRKFLGAIGDAGCFSFSANKTISTGQGGIIVTNSDELAAKIRPLKDQGRTKRGTGGDDLHDTIGYNFKMTDLQAAIGLAQLRQLASRRKRMLRNYALYRKHLADIKEISFFESRMDDGELPQWTDIRLEKRDELDAYLHKQNIECRRYWHPIHRQLAYTLPDNNFPNSTHLCPQSLWLPSAFTLKDADILKVCRAIKYFYGKK